MKSLEKVTGQLLKDSDFSATCEQLRIAACSISVLDENGFITVVAHRGYPETLIEAFRRFSIHEPLPLAEALRTGAPVWLTCAEEHEARYPSNIATFTVKTGRQGWAAIPFQVSPKIRCGFGASFDASLVLSPMIRAVTEAFVESFARRIRSALDV